MEYEMQKTKIEILSTRPLSNQIIEEAAINNIIIDEVSFIETKPIENSNLSHKIEYYLQQNITAIFTSMNAVEAVATHLKQLPEWRIYCIGNTTKKLAENYFGKDSIAGTAASAAELAEVMIKDKITHTIFFCGDQRRDELPEKLDQHDVNIDEVVVYNTNETPVAISKKYDAILFFSPSAADSFFSINRVDEETQLFAIGSTTAKAIQQYNKKNVVIAGSPDKENLVRQVIEYFSVAK
ncbi:MAG: uroporphyrinogen-III synthase [Ginsengibacter sp.]